MPCMEPPNNLEILISIKEIQNLNLKIYLLTWVLIKPVISLTFKIKKIIKIWNIDLEYLILKLKKIQILLNCKKKMNVNCHISQKMRI